MIGPEAPSQAYPLLTDKMPSFNEAYGCTKSGILNGNSIEKFSSTLNLYLYSEYFIILSQLKQ